MLALSIAALVYGVTLGSVLSRYPYYRSPIAIGVLSVIMVIWATVLLWPGHAPIWLLVVLVLVLAVPAPTITAVMTFDIARTSNPARRLGTAIGVINGGAFIGTVAAVMAIGLVLEVSNSTGSRPTTSSSTPHSSQETLSPLSVSVSTWTSASHSGHVPVGTSLPPTEND